MDHSQPRGRRCSGCRQTRNTGVDPTYYSSPNRSGCPMLSASRALRSAGVMRRLLRRDRPGPGERPTGAGIARRPIGQPLRGRCSAGGCGCGLRQSNFQRLHDRSLSGCFHAAPNKLGCDLGHDGVTEGAADIHAGGYPISHASHIGLGYPPRAVGRLIPVELRPSFA